MQAVLIPFLLAANISQHNDATWEHGALIKWKARLNVLGENNIQTLFSLTGTFDINCMAKGKANLLCRGSNFDLETRGPDSANKTMIGTTDTIGITYNDHGVEDLTVRSTMREKNAILIMKVVYILNIGVDFGEKKDELPLLPTTGEAPKPVKCNYNYSIHEELDDYILPTDMPRQHRDYELFLIPHPERKDGHLMILEKHVDAMECDKYGNYFQDYADMTHHPADSKEHSITMKIGDRGYLRIIGHTDRHYTTEEKDGVNEHHFTETLELALDNIEEATEPIPEIEEPLAFGLTADDLYRHYPQDDS